MDLYLLAFLIGQMLVRETLWGACAVLLPFSDYAPKGAFRGLHSDRSDSQHINQPEKLQRQFVILCKTTLLQD